MTTMPVIDTSAEQSVDKKAVRPSADIFLLVVVGGLLAVGLMMVYSTTFDWSYRQYGKPAVIFMRQLQWLGIGLGLMFLAARLPYRWWRRLAVLLMAAAFGALLLVLLLGTPTFGARRSFFSGSVQPSELAKFVVIVYLAVWLDSKGDRIRSAGYGILPFGLIVGLVTGLILLQPDLSAAATIALVAVVMFFVAGADVVQLVVVAVLGSATTAAVVQLSETGRSRLVDYLAGMQDISRASWHVQQAAIAFVNGGLFGRGLGESRQKFGFLPTPHTDSIFAIIGEELGLLGCLAVLLLFVALAWRGFRIAAQAREPLGALLAAGLTCWVSLEALINVAVMVGAMPFAGNALPFISYGGSNLVMTLLAMGVLLNISRRGDTEGTPRPTRPAAVRHYAAFDLSRRDRRGRVSRVVGRANSIGR